MSCSPLVDDLPAYDWHEATVISVSNMMLSDEEIEAVGRAHLIEEPEILWPLRIPLNRPAAVTSTRP
jgi:hypothetical protein